MVSTKSGTNMKTLKTIVKDEYQHTHIDFLKVDIEGVELDILPDFLLPNQTTNSVVPVCQITVEVKNN
jgi:hypothetical protein